MNTSKHKFRGYMACLSIAISSFGVVAQVQEDNAGVGGGSVDRRPNFLVVVADDLGWSDIGVFGGEIRTPTIDALAGRGLSMTQFYAAPTCSPTRSMLLTGVDNHQAGVATMHEVRAPNQLESRNYDGQLHDGVVTVAEVLRQQGYQTMMAGKWHLAASSEQFPHNRGFDKSFSLLQGGASHFGDALPLYEGNSVEYLEDGKPTVLPDDFYSSVSYTDKAIEYLEARDSDAPFFAYMAYTAPHDPLQVPDEWLNRYKGAYAEGPTVIRERRAQRLKEKGLFPENASLWKPFTFPKWLPLYQPEWMARSEVQRDLDARPMEIYAAMVELLDQQVGRLIDYLEKSGELDNTYIIFMSDNGASAATPLMYPASDSQWLFKRRDSRPQNMGKPGSHVHIGQEWAAASGSPWKLYKGTMGEGGIRVPLIVAGPGVVANGFSHNIGHVTDITPTLYALAGIKPSDEPIYADKILPQGKSLGSTWKGIPQQEEGVIKAELFGSRAIRKGRWKALYTLPPFGSGRWELYDMQTDPGETKDVSVQNPDMVQGLIKEYDEYHRQNGIIFPEPPLDISLKHLYVDECDWWCGLKLDTAQTLLTLSSRFSGVLGSEHGDSQRGDSERN